MEGLKDLIFGSATVLILAFVLFIGWIVLLFKRPADALAVVAVVLIWLGWSSFSTLNNPMTWGGAFVVLVSWIVRSNQYFSNQKKEAAEKDAERRQAKLIASEVSKALAAHGVQQPLQTIPVPVSPSYTSGVASETGADVELDKYGMPRRPNRPSQEGVKAVRPTRGFLGGAGTFVRNILVLAGLVVVVVFVVYFVLKIPV